MNEDELYQPLTVQTKQIIEKLLVLEDNNVSEVARILKVTRSTIYNILNRQNEHQKIDRQAASRE